MIVSASRRTDIPAFYMEWMLARLRAGFALVRNPMNPAQVRRVGLTPEEADCIVFWSKNPAPLLARIGELESFGIPFGIIDLSLAPTPAVGDSVGEVLEKIGLEQVGAPFAR